jgi:hypothetical protein
MTDFVTDAFLARASERALVRLHAAWYDVIPRGTAWQNDKGFDKMNQYLPHVNRELVPKRKGTRAQYTPSEVTHGRTESKHRYTCEVNYHEVTDQAGLVSTIIPRNHFHFVNDAILIGHFGSNLYGPLREPARWDERDALIADARPALFNLDGTWVDDDWYNKERI